MKKLLICAAVASACSSALAGGYVGFGAPGAVVWHDQATTNGTDKQELAYAAKVFVGYAFSNRLAVESGYQYLDSMSRSVPGVGTVDIGASAVFLDLVGTFHPWEKIGLFGKVGLAWTTLESDSTSPTQPASANASVHETGPRLGAGAQYDFGNNFSLRGEWERTFKIGSNDSGNLAVSEMDVDVLNITVLYRF